MCDGCGCYQSVKDKNFESNSQHASLEFFTEGGCYQSVKDKNFESNSQPQGGATSPRNVVISLSKIKISKAIHNRPGGVQNINLLLSVCQR